MDLGDLSPLVISNDYPILFFPVRLETRFIDDELRVRIYPDQIAIENHEPNLTIEEVEAGTTFQDEIDTCIANEGGLSEEEIDERRRTAWRQLAHELGIPRASYVARVISEFQEVDESELKATGWTQAPKVRVLPDYFIVLLFDDDDNMVGMEKGSDISGDLSVLRDPGAHTDTLFDDDASWVHDFDQALEKGMAVSFANISDLGNRFSRVIALGVRDADNVEAGVGMIENLIDDHHYTNGLSFFKHYTPTNNTEKEKSGYSRIEEDYNNSYDREIAGAEEIEDDEDRKNSNAGVLGKALGLGVYPEVFRNIELASNAENSYAGAMQTALWPGIGDYYVHHMLSDSVSIEERRMAWEHFGRFIRPRGPFPTIRVGYHPYGILPITSVRQMSRTHGVGWKESRMDSDYLDGDSDEWKRFDKGLHQVLDVLYDMWYDTAMDPERVPRIGATGDPDRELLEVLAMEPTSVSYHLRPMVDDRFIAFLLYGTRDAFFGPTTIFGGHNPSTGYWIKRWIEQWRLAIQPGEEVLQEMARSTSGLHVTDPTILHALGWNRGTPLSNPLVNDPRQDGDRSLVYLRALYNRGIRTSPSASNTLFFDLLLRSLWAEEELRPDEDDEDTPVLRAIMRVMDSTVLEFFNEVRESEDIVRAVKDDPDHGPPSRLAYGVRPSLARRIMEVRETLPGRKFTSIQQIDDIPGVGPDTLHDILKTFKERSVQPILEPLLRETLDLFSHRLDAWITAFATKRLEAMRRRNATGLYIGSYGWVENLDRGEASCGAEPGGFIHAPSIGQASAGAILRNAYLSHKDTGNGNAFRVGLTSDRVRNALRLLDGVREGQPLSALLGFQFERGLHDSNLTLDMYIDDFRREYPFDPPKDEDEADSGSQESIVPRNVVDGMALAIAWREKELVEGLLPPVSEDEDSEYVAISYELEKLLNSLDAVADLLMTESVYQSVQGNYERAGAALEAAAGNTLPPEIECVLTPPSGTSLDHRMCVIFETEPYTSPPPVAPPRRSWAEPTLNAWFSSILGPMDDIGCEARFTTLLFKLDKRFSAHLDQTTVNNELSKAFLDKGEDIPLETSISDVRIGERDMRMIQADECTYLIHVLGDDIEVYYAYDDAHSLIEGSYQVRLSDLAIDPIDFLHMSSAIPEGEQTEIEQRIALHVRNNVAGLRPDQPFRLDMERVHGVYERGLDEALELSRHVMSLVGSTSYLRPEMLCRSHQAHETPFSSEDFQDTLARAEDIHTAFENLLLDLESEGVVHSEEDQVTFLKNASLCGISGAVHSVDAGDPRLAELVTSVNENLAERISRSEKLLEKARSKAALETPRYQKAIDLLMQAVKSLFGEGFIFIPTFLTPMTERFQSALFQENILGTATGNRIRLWMQQAAQTHPAVQRLEDVFLLTDAWQPGTLPGGGQPNPNRYQGMDLKVAQLPYCPHRPWMALADDEIPEEPPEVEPEEDEECIEDTGGRPRGVLSLVVYSPTDIQVVNDGGDRPRVAGLLVDQWNELIPNETLTTGISLQYDQPNSQAPQSLLLAVPSEIGGRVTKWRWREVVEMMRDTIDLVKVRAVDPDAMQGVGQLFPAIFLPIDPARPAWDREIGMVPLDRLYETIGGD